MEIVKVLDSKHLDSKTGKAGTFQLANSHGLSTFLLSVDLLGSLESDSCSLSLKNVYHMIFMIFKISLCFEAETIILIYEDFTYSKYITYIKKETPLLYFLLGSLSLKLYFGPQLPLDSPPDSSSRAMLFNCLIIPGQCCQREQARSLQ